MGVGGCMHVVCGGGVAGRQAGMCVFVFVFVCVSVLYVGCHPNHTLDAVGDINFFKCCDTFSNLLRCLSLSSLIIDK